MPDAACSQVQAALCLGVCLYNQVVSTIECCHFAYKRGLIKCAVPVCVSIWRFIGIGVSIWGFIGIGVAFNGDVVMLIQLHRSVDVATSL